MDLDLPLGPWKEIASADWNGVPTGVYANPGKNVLIVAFSKEPLQEKHEGKEKKRAGGKQGVLVLLKKPLFLEGSAAGIEKFVQSQTRDLTVFSKIIDKKHFTYVLLEAQPFFVEFKKEELAKAVKEQHSELESLAKLTFDVARSYGCRARDLDDADETTSENLLGDPISLFSLGGFKSKRMFSSLEEKKSVLGFTSEGAEVEISPGEMQVTLVSGQGKQPRLKAVQVCVENLLLSGVPCIVVGESDSLQGLAFPSKNPLELEKAGLPKAAGFPLKSYSLGKGFYIDLRFVNAKSFSSLFLPKELRPVVEENWGEHGIVELREKISSHEQKYAFAKTARVLAAAEKAFPGVFAESKIEELKKAWEEKAGRVVFLNAGEGVLHALAVESVLNSLGEPKEGAVVAVALETDACSLPAETVQLAASVQSKVFLLLNTENQDFSSALESISPTLHIELLGQGPEAVASFSGEKKRISLRPAFSSS